MVVSNCVELQLRKLDNESVGQKKESAETNFVSSVADLLG
jgi:hypothetical protein